MAGRKRRNHPPTFKGQVAVGALKGDKTLAESAQRPDVHPNQIAGRPMRKTGIEALYRKPDLSRRHTAHPICRYLPRDPRIGRPNRDRASDITYIPMRRSPVYLVAAIGRYSRKALSWRLSNTPTTGFRTGAVRGAIPRYGKPEIFNAGRGSQFTSHEFTRRLKDDEIRISADSKGC